MEPDDFVRDVPYRRPPERCPYDMPGRGPCVTLSPHAHEHGTGRVLLACEATTPTPDVASDTPTP